MMINIPPAFIYIIGALLIPLIRIRILKQALVLLIPAIAFWNLVNMPHGVYWTYQFLDYELILGRVDKLSMVFAYVFVIMSFIGMVYALHIKEYGQHVAAFLYVGCTLGVVFAGDLFTLFVFWEIMAISSVFLVFYRKTKRSLEAGFRYILVHLFGGCVLLCGIIIHAVTTGSLAFELFDFGTLAAKFILAGFLLNAAVPPLHAWLADAYPEATITGAVFMTAFTTKSAVYVLLRGFPGVELLVWLGAIMALYGVVYAVLENDIRRLLAYHIISQVGYMVCGVGLGSEMAINGASAHAFCHILYKSVLFMGMGAVIYVTGRSKMTDLQGRSLYKKMPITLALYMVGAFSISAVPLFNGFVSKTMVIAAAGALHRPSIELMLHLASIGTFLHTGLKLPWGVWFGTNKDGDEDVIEEAKEPPFNMLLAMGIAAGLCILTGVYPKILYDILPYPVDFHPYDASKVVGAMQMLVLTLAAFWIYIDKLGGEATVSLDTDWPYRMFGRATLWFCNRPLNALRSMVQDLLSKDVVSIGKISKHPYLFLEMFCNSIQGKKVSYQELINRPYNENSYRIPIGLSACAALIFLFLYGVIYMV
ncbi:MAG: Na(+)/H(+) antiporter subunit D [Deltaproteobacteria bacterium]|nr:Na(+)/H(+) antiporter subunit D [Deltaproteobacteria bacterium]MBW1833317.1 Na(+)/H(+) antiporter subunit D [Deltaproteobacteria bacterium]MBW2164646.1 Na(+)/H(+) antiporter subunit D [Deltaproteobacteria bacterium]